MIIVLNFYLVPNSSKSPAELWASRTFVCAKIIWEVKALGDGCDEQTVFHRNWNPISYDLPTSYKLYKIPVGAKHIRAWFLQEETWNTSPVLEF